MNKMLYEPCLCGSGKKMKFCCPDLTADWEKIARLLEADQPVAALEHVNRVIDQRRRQNKPDNPALLAERIRVLRDLDRDQWRDEVDRFAASFPDNPRAIAWQGIKLLDPGGAPKQSAAQSFEENLRAAMDRWLTVSDSQVDLPRDWVQLTLDLCLAMIRCRWIRPAVFILTVLRAGKNGPDWIDAALVNLRSSNSIPLALRHFEDFGAWPEVQQTPSLNEAWSKLCNFDWRGAERDLTELIGKSDAPAAAWRLLAEARLLLGKKEEACEALRAYIAKWPSSADVFEAELLLLSIGPSRECGWVPASKRKWKVLDVDLVQEAMISDSRCVLMDQSFVDGLNAEVRPRVASQLYQSGPLPHDAELTSTDEIPAELGQLYLFGKQTDRDAELVLVAIGERIEPAVAVVQQICGDLIAEMSAEDGASEFSWLNAEILQPFLWPKNLSLSRRTELRRAHAREVILRRWPNRRFECLGGRTFFEAAADPSLRMRLLALIDLEERLFPTPQFAPLFAELRNELGVRTPTEDGRSSSSRFLPLLSRYFDPDTLSDSELIKVLAWAETHDDRPTFLHWAPVFLRRESLRDHEIAPFVCQSLILSLGDRDEAAEWIAFGRQLSMRDNVEYPEWLWILLESRWHLQRGDSTLAVKMLFERLQSHWTDPEERRAFLETAFSLGVIPPQFFRDLDMPVESGASEEPAGLWTPDSAAPAAGGSGSGKLWLPE